MAAELLWTPAADQDLLEIYEYIALENPDAADRIVDRVKAAAELLSHHPRLCQRRPEVRPSLRIMTDWPYLLLYETVPEDDTSPVSSVVVVRVVDGRRNLKNLI